MKPRMTFFDCVVIALNRIKEVVVGRPKYAQQRTTYTCGPAVLSYIERWHGNDVIEEEIYDDVLDGELGSTAFTSINYLLKRDYTTEYLILSKKQIQGFISQTSKKFLLMPIVYIGKKNHALTGHFVGVFGYNKKTKQILILDPRDIKVYKWIHFKEFIKYCDPMDKKNFDIEVILIKKKPRKKSNYRVIR